MNRGFRRFFFAIIISVAILRCLCCNGQRSQIETHTMKNTLCVAIILVLSWAVSTAHAIQDQDTAAIDAFIARQARQARGEEYKEARKVATGDLNHDGVADTAVLYTIEGQGGSNNYMQYLAVFIFEKGR